MKDTHDECERVRHALLAAKMELQNVITRGETRDFEHCSWGIIEK